MNTTTPLKVAAGAFVLGLALTILPATASAGTPAGLGALQGRTGTVVSLESSPYGSVLVVGGAGAGYDPSSPFADPEGYLYPPGSSLYSPTIDPLTTMPAIDPSPFRTAAYPPAIVPSAPGSGPFSHPYTPGCNATTQAVSELEGGPDTCTGSETDPSADWPALTTPSPPVAGPGVNSWLLGSIYRSDLGAFQVTYAGHPLYLFDPGPSSFAGEDFLETVGPALFPWQTAWYLLSPNGTFDAGQANLSVLAPHPGSNYQSNVLGTEMLPNIGLPGGVPVAVYTFSADSPWQSHCYGYCASEFIPLTTVGSPTEQPGVNRGAVGTIWRLDGLQQVTYDGHPLYIYNQEQPLVLGPHTVTSVGNGNGVSGFGGTLSLVNP